MLVRPDFVVDEYCFCSRARVKLVTSVTDDPEDDLERSLHCLLPKTGFFKVSSKSSSESENPASDKSLCMARRSLTCVLRSSTLIGNGPCSSD